MWGCVLLALTCNAKQSSYTPVPCCRFYTQLIEIPLVILLGGTAVSVLLSRCDWLLGALAACQAVLLVGATLQTQICIPSLYCNPARLLQDARRAALCGIH